MFVAARKRNLQEEEERRQHAEELRRQTKAATKIQAIWRGNKQRRDLRQFRLKRTKPFGFYTHSLALKPVVAIWKHADVKRPRRTLYLFLEDASSSPAAKVLSMFIIGTIMVSIAGFIIETIPEVYYVTPGAPVAWLVLEVFCTFVFTLEYLFRLFVCKEAGLTIVGFVCSPLNICDLAAVLPFYVEVILKSTTEMSGRNPLLKALRVVRLVRLIRIFKLGRYASGMRLMAQALKNSSQAISVLVFLLFMGVLIFSSALFRFEQLSCPHLSDMTAKDIEEYHAECADPYFQGFSPSHGLCCTEYNAPIDFPSIPAAFWWSMVTMMTVGYGEIVPRTTLGKCVGFVAMLVGMVLIALPVAIVGQKFQDVYEHHDLDEAKSRAAARLKVTGEKWTLEPQSDVLPRLRALKVKDSALAVAMTDLTCALEEVWEQREQLSRERKMEFEKQDLVNQKFSKLLLGMEASLSSSPAVPAP
eukprot:gnl/TRDRNA2_/TRDRNA2_35298_c0_seq1.p1 gnl/TRDRNA2_/TRDRNA2_35298_c0~~gnl/TRDRNA2_/TRDRNA2_35298_c0_seq1.p1  ORF type:complete len:473 (-),score=74.13 gnl/TRDRNA2_/TRDRNA2_35298_c0_seq1:352-1770(-)